MFWKVGKFVFEKHNTIENVIDKISDFYSYKYGLDCTFSKHNITFMKIFYLYFPVYTKMLEELSWDHYLVLIKIRDNSKRKFYFKTSVFCQLSLIEMIEIINTDTYERI